MTSSAWEAGDCWVPALVVADLVVSEPPPVWFPLPVVPPGVVPPAVFPPGVVLPAADTPGVVLPAEDPPGAGFTGFVSFALFFDVSSANAAKSSLQICSGAVRRASINNVMTA